MKSLPMALHLTEAMMSLSLIRKRAVVIGWLRYDLEGWEFLEHW